MPHANVTELMVLIMSMGFWSGIWFFATTDRLHLEKAKGVLNALCIFSALSLTIIGASNQKPLSFWFLAYGLFLVTFVFGNIFQRAYRARMLARKRNETAEAYNKGQAQIYSQLVTSALINVTSACITIASTTYFVLRFVYPTMGFGLTALGGSLLIATIASPFLNLMWGEEDVYLYFGGKPILPAESQTLGFGLIATIGWMLTCIWFTS
jgi:hypothetical protein